MTSRGKYVVFTVALGAVLVLAVAAFTCWSGLKEAWYLHRLHASGTAVQDHAAEQLEKLGCIRPGYHLFRLRKGHVPHFTRSVEALASAGGVAVGPLLEIVRDRSLLPASRGHAAETLGRIGPQAWRGASDLVALAQEPGLGPLNQSRAIIALGSMDPRNREVIRGLEQFVNRDDLDRCRHAVEALAKLGPEAHEAVPAIVMLFAAEPTDSAKDAFFRAAVAKALRKFGDAGSAAIPALTRELLHPSDVVRSSAARTLGMLGPGAKACVPELSGLLADRHEVVRTAAAEALGRIRDP